MYKDPLFTGAVEALSKQPLSGHWNDGSPDEEAFERLLRPVENARDTILGTFHVLPAVFEEQFGRPPSHEEAINLLKASKRLAIFPSLLDFSQLQSYIIGSTQPPHMPASPYGYDFRPDIFTIGETKNGDSGLVMDYDGGLGGIGIQNFTLDFGDEGAAYVPSIEIDASSAPQPLEELKPSRTTLTCPARKFIVAMWADMVDIADRTKVFALTDSPASVPTGTR